MASLVGLRDRRERVIARLTECYERDLLDVEELDQLIHQAHAAETFDALDALVHGLGQPVAGDKPTEDPTRLSHKTLSVMFSYVERTGHWVVPRRLDARMLFGNVLLDFRDASIGSGVTTLDLAMTFSTLELIVPPWLAIDVDVAQVGGSVEECHRIAPHPDPGEPVLSVVGMVRFGDLMVSTRMPGETRAEARKREKRERAAKLKIRRRALPPARGQM